MPVHMSRDNYKILVLCGDVQLLNSIGKAVFLKFPVCKLFFSNTIAECIAKFQLNLPDIVVIIPKENIWDMCLLIHELMVISAQCQILLASQYTNGKIISEYLSRGVVDIITLPVNMDLLLTKITAIICGNSGNYR
jgi:DNA-binding response OmpR family regulator